ncbi:NAD(P)/FAD-dependent oxidoreductase [Candidatus Bathyarchaeota archaeon]|nr:NAD(P)/FAD-dependent oxidoreductase [Candidatus Bathyarchaeota archaeon]
MQPSYCIIGNSAAAVGAIEAIRKIDAETPITVISKEPCHVYSRPILPYLLSGKIPEERIYYRGKDFYEKNNVNAMLGKTAIAIDAERKIIKIDDGSEIKYSKLLLATGSTPIIAKVPGVEKHGVSAFTTLEDVSRIKRRISEGASKALIVGAGLIGLKAAESLKLLGLDVTVLVRSRVLRRIVDETASKIVQDHLAENGVKIITGLTIKEIVGDTSVEAAVLSDGSRVECDLVIMAAGVKPNVELAKDAGLAVNNGILVNNRMETNVKDVYAAGDVAEAPHMLYDESRVTLLWPIAYKQGSVAGANMAGGFKEYEGSLDMNSLELFHLPIISVGVTNPTDETYVTLTRTEGEKVYRKVVLKKDKLVGVILVGEIDRAGIYTGLIREMISVKEFKNDLLRSDFGYAYLPESIRKERLLK